MSRPDMLAHVIHFVVIANVRLHTPVEVEDDGKLIRVIGYYKNFGVSAPSKKGAREIIAAEVTDGAIESQQTEWRTFGGADENRELLRAFDRSKKDGIWFRSGRAFYPEDELSDTTPSE